MRTGFPNAVYAVVVALVAASLLSGANPCWAQQGGVTAQVEILKRGVTETAAGATGADASNVVVWLSPLDRPASMGLADPVRPPQLVQRDKAFEPHVLVVQAGTTVEFPNKDPFFHNVFSLFNGRRFDLGLYEAGSSKSVLFDRVGVSFLFCNIHEEMGAVVVAVDSPYFGLSDRSGRVVIPRVPDGRYQIHVWFERSRAEDLKTLERAVTIAESTRTLGPIRVVANPDFTFSHKNKYGQDYVPPPTTGYTK